MEKLVTEADASALATIREKVGPESELDFSYGLLTGLMIVSPGRSVRLALTTRDAEHPRGRGLTLDQWLSAIDESHRVKVTFSQA